MNIYTSDEQLHREHAAQCRRDRFMTRWILTGQQPKDRKAFGHAIETDIITRLRASGYSVTRSAANEHFDALVNGLRVEIKAASWSGHRYQAALRSNDADVLILCCRNEDGHTSYFIMPFETVSGLKHIKISSDPKTYTGRHSAWLEAWSLIDQLIARGINHWQPALL